MNPASFLYVPGDRPARFEKALTSGADAVIFDLEDAVSMAAKDAALAAVAEQLSSTPANVEQWVRINSGERGGADLEAIATLPGLTGVVVAKATSAALRALATIADVERYALVETASATVELVAIARADRLLGLAMGEVDLAADLGIAPSADEHELWPFRMQVVAASAAAGLRGPLGPVHTDVRDVEGLRRTTGLLRRAGFSARQAIHPDQIAVINEAMTPGADEIERARALLEAAQAADGAWLDATGRMVDEAVLRNARNVLARSRPNSSDRRSSPEPSD